MNLDNIETTNFIEDIVLKDLKEGKVASIVTRFPPEPNGYLHIGHAKSISINFGIKQKFEGQCFLRYDDTNPTKEDVEYVEAIKSDIRWLGFMWDKECYASDYFGEMFDYAVTLIKKGFAYVDDQTAEEIRLSRGTLTEAGKESPCRNRSAEENLKLFYEMRDGKFADGEKVLRAKIDMASPNMNMRDPVIYRIVRATHHRTGNQWIVYPMYDFAHPIGDALDGVTHSICTLEFEDHRPLYDWVVDRLEIEKKPHQYEFARLNIGRTIMSKRYLKKLVENGTVDGWDDPRMPTLTGMRRRGYPAAAILDFCKKVGVAKANSEVDTALLEACVRENLNQNANRAMVVRDPLKLIIDNFEDGESREFEVENNPNSEEAGKHTVRLTKEIYIERDDFSVNPPPKYKRLVVGGNVRLKGAYILDYKSHETDENGAVRAVHCEYVPDSQSGGANAKTKVKGVVQWVSAEDAADATLYLYDYLLTPVTDGVTDFNERLNPVSLTVKKGAKAEPFLKNAKSGDTFQFMRDAYYKLDGADENGLNFFYIVGLKDSFNR